MVTLSKDAGGSGTYEYWMVKGGELEMVQISDDECVTPEPGNYRTVELRALGVGTYTANGKFGERQKKSLILRILDQDSDSYKELVKTSVNYEETARGLGPKTMIGQIFTAIRGGEYPDGEDIDDAFWASIIGGRFECNLSVSESGQYTNLVKDTIKPVRKAPSRAKTKATDNPLVEEDVEDAA